jgi:hypothetical protein
MADSDHVFSNHLAQNASPRRLSCDGAGQPVQSSDREFAGDGDGDGNCPLWDGHIIDAIFPLV